MLQKVEFNHKTPQRMHLKTTQVFLLVLLSLCYACTSDKEDEIISEDEVINEPEVEAVCDVDNAIDQNLQANRNDHTTDAFETSYVENLNATERQLTVNQIPNHNYGAPADKINEVNKTFRVTLNPADAGIITPLLGASRIDWIFGLALNGCKFDPVAAFPYINTDDGTENWNWVLEGTNNTSQIGLDENQAHLQANGSYHYHGDFSGYANDVLNANSNKMVQCGWAADGFPVYYKYGYSDSRNTSSAVVELKSSYQLKLGDRPGDGISEPCDAYNGKYEQDYEYIAGKGDLDECNGRTGVTPEFPGGTYYYVITSDFPLIPRCFTGTPHSSFSF